MLTVDDYGAIRRARRDGKSIRQIAREFDHSRNTIGRFSSIPSQVQRLGIAAHQNSVPSTGSSTRSFGTTRPPRPSSGTPRRRCSVAFAMNTDYCGGYAQVQRYLLKHRQAGTGDLHPAGPSSRPTPRSRFRPYPRRFPRRTPACSVPGHHLGLLKLSLRSGSAL